MDETILVSPAPQTKADYRAAVEKLIAEMDRMEGLAQRRRVEIEQLKAETKIIGERTDEKIAQLRDQINRLSGSV